MNEVFQLLVDGYQAAGIIDDWNERNLQCDLRVRRAKTKGKVLIELTDPIYANNIRMWHPGCKVAIKDNNSNK